MKRFLGVLGVAMICATPAVIGAQAATDKAVSFGVSAGLSLPVGDFGDAYDAGYGVAGHLFLRRPAWSALRVRADVSFDRWDGKAVDASVQQVAGVANALYSLRPASSGTVRPYVIGGLGVYNVSIKTDENDVTSADFGVQGGAGLTVDLAGFATFVEVKYVRVATAGNATGWIPIGVGVRF